MDEIRFAPPKKPWLKGLFVGIDIHSSCAESRLGEKQEKQDKADKPDKNDKARYTWHFFLSPPGLAVDGRNPALSHHGQPLFLGIYRGTNAFQGFLGGA